MEMVKLFEAEQIEKFGYIRYRVESFNKLFQINVYTSGNHLIKTKYSRLKAGEVDEKIQEILDFI